MRVREVFKDVKLEVKCGDEVIMSLKKPHMAPGEMEKIMIPKVFMDKIKTNKIVVTITK